MPVLYSSLSGSSSDTSTAYSQPFSLRSLSSSFKKSSLRFLVAVSSLSFFISNMIETISLPASSTSRKMKSPLLPLRASLSFSKYARGNAVARMRLNSVSQCCSSVSPTILVERRAFMSLRRAISPSRSRNCSAYCSLMAFSSSCFFTTTRFRSFLSSSRSRATTVTASVTASLRATSAASSCDLIC